MVLGGPGTVALDEAAGSPHAATITASDGATTVAIQEAASIHAPSTLAHPDSVPTSAVACTFTERSHLSNHRETPR